MPSPLELYLRPDRPGMRGIPPPLPIWAIIFCISLNCLTSFWTSCWVAPEPRAILRARLGFCNNLGFLLSWTVIEVIMASTLPSCLSSISTSLSCFPRPGIIPRRPDSGPIFFIICICCKKSSKVNFPLMSFLPWAANLIGRRVPETTESAPPPRASPSSLVRTIPSKSAYSWKASATSTAFWPVTTSSTSSTECGFEAFLTRRVDDDKVVPAVSGLPDAALGDLFWLRPRALRVHRYRELASDLLQLLDSGRPVSVTRDQIGVLPELPHEQRELPGRRRLAVAVESCEHHDRGRPGGEGELVGGAAHQVSQLLVDYLDDLLARTKSLGDLGSCGPLADVGDELLDYAIVHVGLEQGQPDLTCNLLYLVLGKVAATADSVEGFV